MLETSNQKTLKVKTAFLDSSKIQPAFALASRLPSKAAPTDFRLQGNNFFLGLCNFCYIYSMRDTLPLKAFFFSVIHFQDLIELWTVNPLSKRATRFLRVLSTDFPIPFISRSICLRIKVYFPPAMVEASCSFLPSFWTHPLNDVTVVYLRKLVLSLVKYHAWILFYGSYLSSRELFMTYLTVLDNMHQKYQA